MNNDQFTSILDRYLSITVSSATQTAYNRGWQRWEQWCSINGRESVPAMPNDVAVFIATMAEEQREDGSHHYAVSTIAQTVAAISYVHSQNEVPSPTRTEIVRRTMRGIKRVRGSVQRRMRPLLVNDLRAMLDQLPADGWPTGLTRRRDALLLIMGWGGGLRASELAQVRTSDVALHVGPDGKPAALVVELGRTKTDQSGERQERVSLPRGERPETCPICAYVEWTDALTVYRLNGKTAAQLWLRHLVTPPGQHRCDTHSPCRIDEPLFVHIKAAYVANDPLSRQSVSRLVKHYVGKIGLDPRFYSGHSFRAGFATQAAIGGATVWEIMVQGRWREKDMVDRYVRLGDPLKGNASIKLGL